MQDPMTQHTFMAKGITRQGAYDGKSDFSAWQKASRQTLSALLGLDTFEKCAANVEKTLVDSNAQYIEYRVTFNTESHYRAAAHILLPPNPAGKVPAMICVQGHATGMHISLGRAKFPGDENSISGGDRDFAVQTIKKGYAAIALEQRAFGECGGTEKGPDCYQKAMSAMLLGRTLLGERVWDISRLIDLLESDFPEIDAGKIGIVGNSGGGTAILYAAALETRIAAAMPSCAFCGYWPSIGVQFHCSCNYVPSIMKYFDMGDLAGMIAPRPLVVVNGLHDTIFPIASANEQFEITKTLYRAANAEDMAQHVVGSEGHRFYAKDAWPVFDALTGWAK